MTLRDLKGRDRIIGSRSLAAWSGVKRLPEILGELLVGDGGGGDPGYNNDNILRFTLASAETSIKIMAATTSDYFKLRYESTESDVYAGNRYDPAYYYVTTSDPINPILSGLPTGVEKVVELISCDATGSPTGEITAASLYLNDTDVIRVDASGCLSLLTLHLASLDGNPGSYVGVSSQPSSIQQIRAVGVSINNGLYSSTYAYAEVGLNVSGQQLNAAALDQLYSDLSTGVGLIFTATNPGTSGDDPTIATGKGYTVIGS